jgi:hypothetical protein
MKHIALLLTAVFGLTAVTFAADTNPPAKPTATASASESATKSSGKHHKHKSSPKPSPTAKQ